MLAFLVVLGFCVLVFVFPIPRGNKRKANLETREPSNPIKKALIISQLDKFNKYVSPGGFNFQFS